MSIFEEYEAFKAIITTTANDTVKHVVFFFRENKAWHVMRIVCLQTIRIKCQALFSLKNNKINFRM